ncbi:MAG: leucine-rich repeat domain-containing protein, partial [Muribaculaceae bacterium]|nr:leucine-rich repeat domain-containing protein [Muribaculaceae bacterium]
MRKVADSSGAREVVIQEVTTKDKDVKFELPSYVRDGLTAYNIVGIDPGALMNCKMTEIDLSAAVHMTSIGNFAFAGNPNLTTVYLPHTLTTLGTNAFQNCYKLTTVKGGATDKTYLAQSLPVNIKTLPRGIFKGCTSLTKISINGATTAIGDSAFTSCSALTTVGYWNYSGDTEYTSPDGNNYLPQSCASVGNYAFAGTKLASLYMPGSTLKTIGDGAFRSTNLLKKIGRFTYTSPSATVNITDDWLPTTLTSIGNSAFQFSGIETVNMSNNVTSLGYYCFDQCSNLASVTLSTGLTTLPTRAFNQTALTTINTRNVTYIDQFAFSETKITSLTNFNIPKVEEIVNGAFSDISTLTKVEFPSTIKAIGTIAFKNCPNLKLVDFQLVKKNATTSSADEGVFVNSDAFDATQKANARLYVPYGYEESFYTVAGTKDFAFKPIVGGGTFALVFADGKIDADKHYHYVVTTAAEQLHGIEPLGDNALLVRDELEYVTPAEQGDLEDYPSLSKLTGSDNFEYSRYPWYIFQGLGAANAGSLLSGNICLEIVDRVNP